MTPTLPPAPAPAPAAKSNKTVLIIVFVFVGLMLFCMCGGILAAIAIPNFVKYQARAKMSECKTNLKALYTAQRTHFAEKDDYGDTAEDVAFTTSGSTRYTYFGGPEFILPATHVEAVEATEDQLPPLAGDSLPGVEGECPADCQFTAACAGNIDFDETLDVWSISTGAREKNGQTIAPGEPFHEVDDGIE